MPVVELRLFREEDGTVPLIEWLDRLPSKARDKCLVRLERLRELGHELRRPEADILRDDTGHGRAWPEVPRYRMLYFFHGRTAVVVSHGFAKPKARVAPKEINLAVDRKLQFERDPERYSADLEM